MPEPVHPGLPLVPLLPQVPQVPQVPIACTLTPASGAAQLKAWQSFNEDFPPRVQRSPEMLRVRYSGTADSATGDSGTGDSGTGGSGSGSGGVVERLAALVETERGCCGFAEWTVAVLDDGVVELTVTGSAAALDSLGFLAPDA